MFYISLAACTATSQKVIPPTDFSEAIWGEIILELPVDLPEPIWHESLTSSGFNEDVERRIKVLTFVIYLYIENVDCEVNVSISENAILNEVITTSLTQNCSNSAKIVNKAYLQYKSSVTGEPYTVKVKINGVEVDISKSTKT